jgi:hypothetical protein
MSEERHEGQQRPLFLGLKSPRQVAVFMAAFLSAQTVVEYLIGQFLTANVPVLLAINIAEAAAIVYYFQHVYRLWRED